ncbi:phosphatase domain-containing protein [Tateyamaria armeniaca]|uniref:Phosphatase domain-containing protein n=1 Tax=Tateyamaria armeniaca TaxID=2518930 RepID=A0ABW8UPZ8_9RHOB
MSIKTTLARVLHPIERLVDRLKRRQAQQPLIEPYLGYATPDTIILRGRVLSAQRRGQPKPDQSRWTNFRQMLSLFATDEVGGVQVRAAGVTALSDEEGYFTLTLPRQSQDIGWITHTADLVDLAGVSAQLEAQVPHPDARRGIISDIDDTMLETGAYSLARNLWTSLTGNALTREIFADSIALIDHLHDGRNPVFYVSSSPWNLFHFLRAIFERHGLLRAPMFLRDLGLSETQFITGTHGDHKGAAIDTLLAANPTLPFVLIGDTGQHDAHVYLDAALRHPGRIERVILRQPGPGPDANSRAAIDDLRAVGVTVDTAPNFAGLTGDSLSVQARDTPTPRPLNHPAQSAGFPPPARRAGCDR